MTQSIAAKSFSLVTTLIALAFFAIQFATSSHELELGVFIYWLILVGVADASAVDHPSGSSFTMVFPLALAMAVIFAEQPWIPMAIIAVGAIDLREFKGEIEWWRAFFNRAQLLIASGAAALVVKMGADPTLASKLLFLFPAAAVHFAINFGVVVFGTHLRLGRSLRETVNLVLPQPRSLFALSTALFVFLGGACAVIYLESPYGAWLVPTMLIPLFFARLSLVTGQRQVTLANELADKQKALLIATDNVFRERESERARIAEEIHDTTLQNLAAVSLMARKSRRAMGDGELTDAAAALETVVTSAEESVESLRQSVMDLRRSQLESEDLRTTVDEFVRNVQTLWGVEIGVEWNLASTPAVPVAIAAFQIIHEGVMNALRHSGSTSIAVRADEADGSIRISVEDNGRGFDPEHLEAEGHLGVQLMRSRAEAVGGVLAVESAPNNFTRIRLTVPAR